MSTVTCEVEPSCAATAGGERATKFGGKVGVPPREQRRLLFAVAGKGKGRRLGDGRGGGSALAGFYWYGNLLLGLRRRGGADGGGGSMQVFVRTPAGSTLTLDVSPSDTVGEVKARIQARDQRVAAGQQRLVFAGRHLDDERRTLADYGVGKEANLHLLLRLRGGLAGGHTNTGTAAAIGNPHWMTTVGLLATVVAVGAVLHCCFPPSASCSGGLGGAFLFFMLAVAVAGVNLITAGVCLTRAPAAESLSRMARFVLSRAAAFPRRNVAVLGVAAATGIIVGDAQAQPVLSFVCFAPFLVSMALVTIGIASSTR